MTPQRAIGRPLQLPTPPPRSGSPKAMLRTTIVPSAFTHPKPTASLQFIHLALSLSKGRQPAAPVPDSEAARSA